MTPLQTAPQRDLLLARKSTPSSTKRSRKLLRQTAAIMAGVSLGVASSQTLAADDKLVSELQAEIARLRQALADAEKGAAAKSTPPPAKSQATPSTARAKPAPAPAKTEEFVDEKIETLDAVVVRARNRAEKLQDIPVAVSVVSGAALERDGGKTFADAASRAAGINVNEQNARQSSITIRGLGKQGQTDAMETSVGVIVDNVFYSYSAMSWQNLVDIDQVEILRGPQGTLLGKNTNLGVVTVSTKPPSFTQQSTYEAGVGKNGSFIGKASSTGPLIDGLLAYRASFYGERQIGDTPNGYNPNQKYQGDRERLAGKFQLLLTPSEDLTARFIFDIQPRTGEADNGGALWITDPTTFADGKSRNFGDPNAPSSLKASQVRVTERLSRDWFSSRIPGYSAASQLGKDFVWYDNQQLTYNGQQGASAEVNWNIGSHTLTSITAYRGVYFHARNDYDGTPFSVNYNWNTDTNFKQFSEELRLSSKTGGALDYQTGLYFLHNDNTVNTKQALGPDAGAWYATAAQYASLNANAAGRSLLSDSLNYTSWTLTQKPKTDSAAIFGQLNWHFTDQGTLTLGARLTNEKRTNTIANTLIDAGVGATIAADGNDNTAKLLFGSSATYSGLNAAQKATVLAAANAAAQKYFGTSTYAALTSAQKTQLGNAAAIRAGQLKTFYAEKAGTPINSTAPSLLISPSWKLNKDTLLYASVSYGQKSGLVYFNTSDGTPQNAEAEQALDYELGFKSSLFNRTLVLNANLYQTNIKNYQQQLQVADASQSSGWRTVTGNVPRVQLRGIEFDGAYSGIKNLGLRFAGAIADAKYKDFKNAGAPAEVSDVATVVDFTGKTLPGASRYTFNLGLDYSYPFLGNHLVHASLNSAYHSKTNLATDLSDYGWIPDYSVTDLAVGIGKQNGQWDLTFLVKNLFDTRYAVSQSAYNKDGSSPVTSSLGASRFYGLVLRGKL